MSVSNLPFVIRAVFWIKIAFFAMGDQHFTYHLRYKMVSTVGIKNKNIKVGFAIFIFPISPKLHRPSIQL